MKLIAISWPEMFEGEARIINALFDMGLPVLHLRKPGIPESEVERLIMHISPEFYDRLTLHYSPQLAERQELGGYHLSKGSLAAPDEWEGRLSASCHSIDEIPAALQTCDYVFLSPIFDSISKAGYTSNFTTDQIAQARKAGIINRRVIALGGVTPEAIPYVEEMGFGGAAVLGGLWGDRDYETVIRNYWQYISVHTPQMAVNS